MLSCIVSIDANYGIGYKNSLLKRLKGDMVRFKKITTGNVVIMGYHTFMSLPKSKPLPDRTNIVITHRKIDNPDVITYDNIRPVIEQYADCCNPSSGDAWVIGGESIYKQLLPFCTYLYITRMSKAFEDVDAYFPMKANNPFWNEWAPRYSLNAGSDSGIKYRYEVYRRNDDIITKWKSGDYIITEEEWKEICSGLKKQEDIT